MNKISQMGKFDKMWFKIFITLSKNRIKRKKIRQIKRLRKSTLKKKIFLKRNKR